MSEQQNRWEDPEGRFDWKPPTALKWGEWDDWRDNMKKRFPVRYFFYETIPDAWDAVWKYGIYKFFHNLKWKILHRFHPKHQYHIIRTRLEPGYYDPDTQIMEGVFALLCDYVENNTEWGVINWEGDEAHAAAWKEMNELAEWFKEVYPNREEELQKERPEPGIGMKKLMDDKYKEDPDVVAYKKYLDLLIESEKVWAKEDEEMLIRAIKVRPFMWYA